MLLVNGANPKSQDSEGLTPAMWACHFDQIENLQILLATEEKLNPSPEARFEVVDNLGRTILHWAVTKTNNINCMRVWTLLKLNDPSRNFPFASHS